MGFSVVSLVELVYFAILRPYFCRFYYSGGRKINSKVIPTISKVVCKNQQKQWPISWFHGYGMGLIHQPNQLKSAHQKIYRNRIIVANKCKPTSYPNVFPYID